jgi:hypothetical protein
MDEVRRIVGNDVIEDGDSKVLCHEEVEESFVINGENGIPRKSEFARSVCTCPSLALSRALCILRLSFGVFWQSKREMSPVQ